MSEWKDIKASPEYQDYHRRVVDACCALMGERDRYFFDEECDYLEYFEEKDEPEDVAQYQYEALIG